MPVPTDYAIRRMVGTSLECGSLCGASPGLALSGECPHRAGMAFLYSSPQAEPGVRIWRVAQPLLAFAPYRTRRAALPQRALQERPEAGRSSVPRLMDNRFGNREDGQELLVGPPGKAAFWLRLPSVWRQSLTTQV